MPYWQCSPVARRGLNVWQRRRALLATMEMEMWQAIEQGCAATGHDVPCVYDIQDLLRKPVFVAMVDTDMVARYWKEAKQ